MAAPKGNNFNKRFKTPKERREAFEMYCAHIAQGYSGESFCKPCVEKTIRNIMKQHPEDCDLDLLEAARAEGRLFWEKIGMAGTTGKIKGFNPSSWIFNMKNRLGWKDKSEVGFDKDARAVFRLSMGKTLPQQPPTKGK